MWRLLPRGIKQAWAIYGNTTTGATRVDEMKLIWEHAERDYSDFPLSNKCN